MGMILRAGYCRWCNRRRLVNVSEDREYTQDDLDSIATDECDCDMAQKQRKKEKDVKRCESFIAGVVSTKFPYMTQLLEFDVQSVASGETDKITRKKDGYSFITGPTKDRIVDIRVRWSLKSEPDAQTPLTAVGQEERIQNAPEAENAPEPVPEEV